MAEEENTKLNTTESEAESTAKTKSKSKAKSTSNAKTKAESKSKTKSTSKTTKSKSESKSKTTKAKSESKTKTTTKRKTKAASDDESETTTKSKAKSTSKTTKAKSESKSKTTTKRKTKASSDDTAKTTTKKRSTTRKKKSEEPDNQEIWDLTPKAEEPEKPAEEPAVVEEPEKPAEEPTPVDVPEKPTEEPAAVDVPEKPAEEPTPVDVPEKPDDGTKVIDIDDYQPVIWISQSDETEEKASAESAETAETSETAEAETAETAEVAETDEAETKSEPAEAAEENRPEETPAEDFVQPSKVTRIAGAAFVGVLVLMFVLNIVIKDTLYSDQENRVFQQFPKFSIGNYLSGRFESQLDNYASDQFAGRSAFIKIKSSADLTIGQIKANGVFKAKENYLMEDIAYPDEASVNADITALRKFKKKYPDKKMYFMLVPNAANILSDKLPAGVVTHDQNADIDRVLKAVKEIGYKPIDVRDELTKASEKEQVYYRTDHHWTTDGAFAAYKKAAKVMGLKSETEYDVKVVKKDFVGTLYSKSGFTNGRKDAIKIYMPKGDKYLNSVIRYKDKKEKTTMYYNMDNLDIKDAYTVFGGTNQSLITISTPTKSNKHLLVVKDSYANCFIPFLTQDYRTITIVDPRYYYENIATVIKADEIDDVLFLYNANTFFDDNYMRMMLTNK